MKIGVDLGGTKIQIGLEENGKIIGQQKILLSEKDSLDATLEQITAAIRPFLRPEVEGIGIGVPSVVDTEKGIVYNVTNIPSWKKVPLKEFLENEFNLEVKVNNDVNCFILGEHRYGLAQPYKTVVGISIGTGLGSGLILDNKLFIGHNCGAGEIGLLSYLDQNIEYYASGNFFSVTYGISALEAYRSACKGDLEALDQWRKFGRHFGKAVLAVLYAYDPEAIVIGGSISKAYSFFQSGMEESLLEFIYPESFKRLKILISENDHIPVLGAAALIN
ncbi:ROK family protein [Echinicola salinicaeni]|uniref:ROK family protein n=1 Tax=Echinicola salinicaeni TaxID=2762757 RepID=UPI0016482731|nr:ROK family protein [Echinicola salinicaeni]